MTKPKEKRFFHAWHRKTRKYSGPVKTSGYVPAQEAYVYEEYDPPPYKDPDGLYVVRHNAEGALKQLVQKEGDKILDISGKVISEYWCDYTVEAYIPHVEWVNEEDNSC